jgi:hypothetical protein
MHKFHLIRHFKTCKIKNGGMKILVDKVKYEQEIRILKEKDVIKDIQLQQLRIENDKQFVQLQDEINELKNQIKKISVMAVTNIINDNSVINNVDVKIIINNYLQPKLDHLTEQKESMSLFTKTFCEKRVNTPIALIPLIWFNESVPENFSIYLVNKSSKEIMTFDGDRWVFNNFDSVSTAIRNKVYEITEKMINEPQVLFKYDQFVANNINKNLIDDDVIKYEREHIYRDLVQNRHMVKPDIL